MPEELHRDYVEIDIEDLIPLEVDLREMTEEEENLLAQSIRETGMVEPLQVVKYDSKYKIVNGMHRFRILTEVFGMKKIPCIIVGEEWDDIRFWQEAIRLNNIRGEFNPVALAKKVIELYEKTKDMYDKDTLKRKLGFSGNKSQFEKIFDDVAKSLPPEIKKKLNKVRNEIDTIEDLSNVLKTLFKQYGKTLEENYMIFTWGGREVLLVRCDSELWEIVKLFEKYVSDKHLNMRDVFKEMLRSVFSGGEPRD
jgi:hypothetical protein